ncbi:MAG: hypothetical protein NVSMB40_18330 [Aquirhabdus sp.]
MFDIGLSELLLLGAVALIVLGPEKLPHAARMAGAWYGRIRRTLSNVQAEIANEVHLAEMRQKMNDELAQIRDAKDEFVDEMHTYQQDLEHSIYPTASSDATGNAYKNTNWSHGIEAPIKSYTQGYYFFFVPHTMYQKLIPATPFLPKNMILKHKQLATQPTNTEKLNDAVPL